MHLYAFDFFGFCFHILQELSHKMVLQFVVDYFWKRTECEGECTDGVEDKDKEYVTSAGERWRWIATPHFRRTNFPTANQFVSHWGRVLNNQGDVTQADYDYVNMSVPSKGSSLIYNLHVVVAYTFVGPPPFEDATVDHINRMHFDNRSANLRWVTPLEQMENREFFNFVVQYNGEIFTDYESLSQVTGKRKTYLRGVLKRGCHDDIRVLKKVRMQTGLKMTSTRWKPPKRQDRHIGVFEMFLDGLTTDAISRETGFKLSTVVEYVVKGFKSSSGEQRAIFRKRIGLDSEETLKQLCEIVAQFRSTNPSKEDWEQKGPNVYLSQCATALPPLSPEDYRIVQCTYRVILQES
jgi:hypothetical protein